MVKLIAPLDIFLKDILPYLKEQIQKHLGTQDVEVLVITKVGDQVQMRDTFKTDTVDYQILMLEGIASSLKAKKVLL
jgi:PleD family two-component response regulator